MFKIGFVGVPGSGKTTAARMLAANLKDKYNLDVELISEYARDYIRKNGFPNGIWEQRFILEKQIEKESSIPFCDVLITDSPMQLGMFYLLEQAKLDNVKDSFLFGDSVQKYLEWNRNELNKYDVIFNAGLGWKPVDDGVRPDMHLDDDWREKANQRMLFFCSSLFPSKNELVDLYDKDQQLRLKQCIQYLDKYMQNIKEGKGRE